MASRKPIVGVEQVTPEWLTGVLYDQGILDQGQVLEVTSNQPQRAFAAITCQLDIRYSANVSLAAPRKLFLKCSDLALAAGEGSAKKVRREIDFYQRVADMMQPFPTVPCYSAAYDPHTAAAHLMLLDVSATHESCLDPQHEQNPYRAVTLLARLHAFWWDHVQLGTVVGRLPTLDALEADWADGARRTREFIHALGDQLPKPWRTTYERVLQSLPKLYQRHVSGKHLTLVHGDAHLGNFLFPRAVDSDATYLIDWQFWHLTIGATDLAFMIATEWESEIRQRLEKALIQRYHATLLQHGVQHYGWDECWNDYRLAVILMSIFIPVWRWSVFKWEADLKTVEKSMAAFDTLGCADLL